MHSGRAERRARAEGHTQERPWKQALQELDDVPTAHRCAGVNESSEGEHTAHAEHDDEEHLDDLPCLIHFVIVDVREEHNDEAVTQGAAATGKPKRNSPFPQKSKGQ